MYAEFFGLRELPFNNTPDPRFFYSTPDHEEALASLIYAVKERKGFVLLTGEVGAGKTLVSRLMLKHFAGTIAFANVNHAIRGPGDLMESLCAEFEIPHEKNAGNTQLVRMLHDFLLAKFAQNTGVVLVLDEAQNLSVEAFEQLRMIGNLEADDAKLLQIAIVGQPELQTIFQSTALRQLRQRLFRSFHLPALDRNAVDGYIRHRLTVAGGADPGLFAPRAIDLIHKASRGLPRLINTICDNAMLSAYSADRKTIDAAFIESVLNTIMVPPAQPAVPALEPAPAPPVRMAVPTAPRTAAPVPQRHDQSERLELACAKAAEWNRQLEAGAQRAKLCHEELARSEKQVTALLKGVKSSAAQLGPMLDELNAAVRGGTQCNESAQSTLRRLTDQTARAQVMLERMNQAVHQSRLAEIQVRHVPQRATAEAAIAGRTEAEVTLRNSQPAEATVLREAQALRTEVALDENPALFSDPGRPALRLARRMEDLADLVHQAVAACTPAER